MRALSGSKQRKSVRRDALLHQCWVNPFLPLDKEQQRQRDREEEEQQDAAAEECRLLLLQQRVAETQADIPEGREALLQPTDAAALEGANTAAEDAAAHSRSSRMYATTAAACR